MQLTAPSQRLLARERQRQAPPAAMVAVVPAGEPQTGLGRPGRTGRRTVTSDHGAITATAFPGRGSDGTGRGSDGNV